MRLFGYLKRRAALLDELEALRSENARLRYDLATARLVSWIRRQPAEQPKRRADPHPVQPGRHHRAEQTEIAPRRQR